MEAPNPSVTVAPLESSSRCSSRRSRLGPVCGTGEGVFQPLRSGKYALVRSVSSDESLPTSSATRHRFGPSPAQQLSPITFGHSLEHPNTSLNAGLPSSRRIPSRTLQHHPTCASESSPGRPNTSFVEAPDRSNPVELPASDQHSRPGPVIGDREGVFQTRPTGEYSSPVTPSLPDGLLLSSHPHPNDQIRIYYQNVRGLKTKIDAWFLAATSCDYDAIVLTETWLDDRIYDAQLFGTDFEVYRADRNDRNSSKRSGGGVLIAVRRTLASSRVVTQYCEALEQVWVRISLPEKSLFCCSFYLPPDRVNSLEFLDGHLDSLRWIETSAAEDDEVIVFGDFNMPGIHWVPSEGGGACANPAVPVSRLACCALLDGMAFVNMQQLNTKQNTLGRILDLVFAKSFHTVTEAADILIETDAHHPPLELMLLAVKTDTEPEADFSLLNFRKINFAALTAFLRNCDWSVITNCNDVDTAVARLLAILNSWLSANVPRMKKRRGPPWSNKRLRKLKTEKNTALRRKRGSNCPALRVDFRRASAAYVNLNAARYRGYVRRMQGNLRRNPKSFWAYVNSKKKHPGLPISMFLGEETCASSSTKCSLFAEHFAATFCDETLCDYEMEAALAYVPSDVLQLDTFEVTERMVTKAASKMKTSYSAGPDGIPAVIYKKCAAELMVPLLAIINSSMEQERFPSAWKRSFMFPVFKKGDKQNIQNYRGITSLCAGSKLFELIVHDYLQFRSKSYISMDQHGFLPGRSVVTNLLSFTTFCIDKIERGFQVDAIYTDLKAAFDRVNHRILLAKLSKLGATCSFVNWLQSYLVGRTLQVRIANQVSNEFTNPSGVPQGSTLGPKLYNLCSNDSVFALGNGARLLYADDLKIYKCIQSLDDCISLQQLLTAFASWCSINRMKLSIEKCTAISYHRKERPILFDYMLEHSVLSRSVAVRDLGVMLDSNLNFNRHRSEVIDKANRQLGFILKISKDFNDPYCLRSLYCALVRSHLEFAAIIWTPHQAVWIGRFERIQKRFIRCALAGLPWNADEPLPPYEHRCQLLNLDTLENRRRAEQASFVSRLLLNEIDSPRLLSQLQLNVPLRPTRTFTLLRPNRHRTNYGLHEPFTAMVYQFNRFYQLFDFDNVSSSFKFKILMMLRQPNRDS